ncbi:MAG: hypothetical protein ACJ8IR_09010 [Alphaproteobacteria bacterium]
MPSVMREMVYIDAGGRLYRGFGRCYPSIVWHQEGARWTVCELPTPQDWDWGDLVTVLEAERCYPGSTTAQAPEGVETAADLSGEEWIRFRPELFDYYDGPIYRKSPQEEAEDMADVYELASLGRIR